MTINELLKDIESVKIIEERIYELKGVLFKSPYGHKDTIKHLEEEIKIREEAYYKILDKKI